MSHIHVEMSEQEHEYEHEFNSIYISTFWKWKEKNYHMNVKPWSQARDWIEKIKFAWVKMNINLSML